MPRGQKPNAGTGPVDPRTMAPDVATRLVAVGRSYFSADADIQFLDEWDVKQDWLTGAILGVCAMGDTIMLSKTKRGDALALGIKGPDGNWENIYIRDAEGFDRAMQTLVRAVAGGKGKAAA